jgi:hypothetical protein
VKNKFFLLAGVVLAFFLLPISFTQAASPDVASVTETIFATDDVNHPVDMPGTVAAGDLLLIFITTDGNATVTKPTGWTQYWGPTTGTALRAGGYAKVAVGDEGSTTINFVTSAAEQAAAQVYRIQNWYGALGGLAVGSYVISTTTAPGGTTADPPSLSPVWGVADALWISVVHTSSARTIVSGSAGYSNLISTRSSETSNAGQVGSMRLSAHSATEDPDVFTFSGTGVTSISQAIAIAPANDSVPTAFSFTAQIDVVLSSVATSNTLTISGINVASAISIVGGTYSINGGAYVSTAGTVTNGQTVTVQQTASASYSTTTTATLTIGGVSGAFDVTTEVGSGACTAGNPNANVIETTPTSSFIDHGNGTVTHNLTGLMWKQAVQGPIDWSTALAAAAADTTAGHSDWRLPNKKELESIVEHCGYSPSINQTLFPSTPAIIFWSGSSYVPNPSLAWGVLFFAGSSTTLDKTNTRYVRLVRDGQPSDSFDAQNDSIPAPFSFTAQTGVALSSVATSDTLTVSGINVASAISIAGGTYSINGGAYVSTAGTVTNGDTVTVQQTASASYSTTTTATLTIGGVSGAFDVTTLAVPVDTVPTAFSFTAQTGAVLSSVATSDTLTVSGINVASAISIVGGTYSINGGAYVSTAGTVTNGDSVTLQQTASGSYSTTTTATLTIGGVGGAFDVTTMTAPVVITSYTAPSATGSGSITASFTGGGASCGYTMSQYIPLASHAASPPTGTAPAGVNFPHGLFNFITSSCATSATLTFTITYQQALPPGTAYWKYGPTAGNISPHWYQLPAVIAGNTATFSITDGGLGDDDLTANGTIVDQGGPGMSGGAVSIPTLSEWALLSLAGLMGLFGVGAMRRRSARRL